MEAEIKYWPGTSMRPPEFALRVAANKWEVCSYGSPRASTLTDADVTTANGWTALAIPDATIPVNYFV